MTAAPPPSTTSADVGALVHNVASFISNRTVHKLAGTALASFGLVVNNWHDLSIGALYAALMHVTGGLKKLPD